MTEAESRAYLESVWGEIKLEIRRIPGWDKFWTVVTKGHIGDLCASDFLPTTKSEALIAAVAYTQKLQAEIVELEEEIAMIKLQCYSSVFGVAVIERTIARLRAILAEKRAGMRRVSR